MKKLIALVLVLVCMLSLVCCNTPAKDGNEIIDGENTSNISGTKLSDGEITFELNPQIKELQIANISIITNTTVVTVTANNIHDDMEIALYIYNAEDETTPIMYATLTAKDCSVDFTNLTAACAYKVGAEIKNGDNSVTLTITD